MIYRGFSFSPIFQRVLPTNTKIAILTPPVLSLRRLSKSENQHGRRSRSYLLPPSTIKWNDEVTSILRPSQNRKNRVFRIFVKMRLYCIFMVNCLELKKWSKINFPIWAPNRLQMIFWVLKTCSETKITPSTVLKRILLKIDFYHILAQTSGLLLRESSKMVKN